MQGEITSVSKTGYHTKLLSDGGGVFAITNNSFQPYGDVEGLDKPLVGDVVDLVLRDDQHIITNIAPRRSHIARFDHDKQKYQGFAANVDVVFVVTSANREFSVTRLRRFLALSGDQDIKQVVVLTKKDLCKDIGVFEQTLKTEFAGVGFVTLNALDGAEVKKLTKHIPKGGSVILLGTSGVGKSTIINTLCDAGIKTAATMDAKWGDKGRHTTSSRNMYFTRDGRKIIDVPGIKIVGIEGDVARQSEVFEKIQTLAAGCRFNNCRHLAEPNCAVKEAVERGELNPDEFATFLQIVSPEQ